jgi:hypothetical protein
MMMRLNLVALLCLSVALISACGQIPATGTPVAPTATQSSPTAVPPTATAVAPTETTAGPTVTAAPTGAPATVTPGATPISKPTVAPRIVLTQVSVAETTPGVIHVAGKAQVFEAMLAVTLVDATDEVIAIGYARASMGAPEWGDFGIDFYYPPPATAQQVTLQAYEPSPKDGSPNSLVETDIVLRPAPELATWKTFDNPTYGFQVKYPTTWHVNQGSVMPAPPLATKLSTYEVRTPGQPLGDAEAEIWITVSDAPSVAEMDNLKAKGYKETAVVLGGRQGVRYTAAQPGHGVYDVVYTLSGPREYRIQLSAATHAFDSAFALVLATFSVVE